MGMQPVLLKTNAYSMYYKTKLQVYKSLQFKTRAGYCYTWDATHADLSSDVFAKIQNNHFKLL